MAGAKQEQSRCRLIATEGCLMPKGPQGQKRPADVIGNAVKVIRIATGEEEETREAHARRGHGALGRAKPRRGR